MTSITCQSKKAEYRFREIFGAVSAAKLTEVKATIANRLGISIAQLNRIIRGDSDPSGTQLLILAESFSLSVDDLYYSQQAQEAPTGAFLN
jgi:transcriptional regulator with XRE-family HTH domain